MIGEYRNDVYLNQDENCIIDKDVVMAILDQIETDLNNTLDLAVEGDINGVKDALTALIHKLM